MKKLLIIAVIFVSCTEKKEYESTIKLRAELKEQAAKLKERNEAIEADTKLQVEKIKQDSYKKK